MLSAHPAAKHWTESAAITTAMWTWIIDAPLGQLAAGVSLVYVSLQLAWWLFQRYRDWRKWMDS